MRKKKKKRQRTSGPVKFKGNSLFVQIKRIRTQPTFATLLKAKNLFILDVPII